MCYVWIKDKIAAERVHYLPDETDPWDECASGSNLLIWNIILQYNGLGLICPLISRNTISYWLYSDSFSKQSAYFIMFGSPMYASCC